MQNDNKKIKISRPDPNRPDPNRLKFSRPNQVSEGERKIAATKNSFITGLKAPGPLIKKNGHKEYICVYCGLPIVKSEVYVKCPDCGSYMHSDCWDAREGCSSIKCRQ